jgi:hypothetical protein
MDGFFENILNEKLKSITQDVFKEKSFNLGTIMADDFSPFTIFIAYLPESISLYSALTI